MYSYSSGPVGIGVDILEYTAILCMQHKFIQEDAV